MNKNIVKIDEKFSFFRDAHCWHLWELVNSEAKSEVNKYNFTYYSSLINLANHVIDKKCGMCQSLKEIRVLLKDSINLFTKYLEDKVNDN